MLIEKCVPTISIFQTIFQEVPQSDIWGRKRIFGKRSECNTFASISLFLLVKSILIEEKILLLK